MTQVNSEKEQMMSDSPWRRHLQFLCGALLVLSLVTPLSAAAQDQVPPTTLTPRPLLAMLPPIRGDVSGVYAINDRGQMVGYSSSAQGQRAALWQGGKVMELPTLGGDSMALDINNHGQVVGWSKLSNGRAHAVLWENGAIRDLGLLKPDEDTYANKINEVGQVVGGSATPDSGLPPFWDFPNSCFFWDKGTMTAVAGLGQRFCRVIDFNDAGQLLGTSDQEGFSINRAFVWEKGVTTNLGSLGGAYTGATDINNLGQIVGMSATGSQQTHAFLWQHGVMADLGTLSGKQSYASSINDAGDIAGADVVPGFGWHAVLWHQGKPVDIARTLDADSSSVAVAINAGSQAVVVARSPAVADPWDQTITTYFWDQGAWNSLGSIREPAALNARGQVVGNGNVTFSTPSGSYTVPRGWLWQPGLAGLTLYNRLDSQSAVEHSAYGPDGTFGGGEFVPGRSGGSAYRAQFNQTGLVSFPKEVVNGSRGAIHFWARLTDLPANIGRGQNPGLVGIRDTAGSYYGLAFNARDLHGNGGLCAAAGQFFTAGTGPGTDTALLQAAAANGWTYTDALGGPDPAQWHHYALVWDEDGILGLGDGTLKVAALVDGKLITQRTQNDLPLSMNSPVDGRLALLDENTSLLQGSVEFADLSVWSYARLEPAELAARALYLPRLGK